MSNKIAMVTGSSRGIGRATALQLAEDGYDLIIHYNQSKDKAEEVQHQIESMGRRAFLIRADLSQELDISQIPQKIETITDKLDLLVNNAGLNICKNIGEYLPEEINSIIQLILTQKIRLTQIATPLLKRGNHASIINIASRLGLMVETEISIYCAAQAGLIHFTKASAVEFSKFGIRVNCIAPGSTQTDLVKTVWSKEKIEQVIQQNPLKRLAEPEEIANAVSFLASEKANYINGVCLEVSGGRSLV